ncbi:MAG: carbohydrate ABC transporter permease [Candidatus Hadarchaeales archaeon]
MHWKLTPVYIVLGVTSVLVVAPLILTFFSSLKSPDQFLRAPWTPPYPPTFDNFVSAWYKGRFNVYFKNSVIISTVDALLMVFIATTAAYAFAFLRFPGNKALLLILILGLMAPVTALILPLYAVMNSFGLVNTRLAVIAADLALALPFFIFIVRAYFLSIPNELRDAAKVDGANEFRIFWNIMFPLAKPIVTVVALLEFLWSWNDLLLRLVFLTKDPLRTLTVGLLFFQGLHTHDPGGSAAAALIIAGPVIALFLVFQRQFIQGLTQGAFK